MIMTPEALDAFATLVAVESCIIAALIVGAGYLIFLDW